MRSGHAADDQRLSRSAHKRAPNVTSKRLPGPRRPGILSAGVRDKLSLGAFFCCRLANGRVDGRKARQQRWQRKAICRNCIAPE